METIHKYNNYDIFLALCRDNDTACDHFSGFWSHIADLYSSEKILFGICNYDDCKEVIEKFDIERYPVVLVLFYNLFCSIMVIALMMNCLFIIRS